MGEVYDLSGYKVRELSWIEDRHPDHSYSYLANGDLIGLAGYSSGEYQIRVNGGLGGCYAAANKEAAIQLCNEWQRQEVMRLLEKS